MSPRWPIRWFIAALGLTACSPRDSGRATPLAPTLLSGGIDRPTVLVNPSAGGDGAPSTIQQAIDLVEPGGRVLILPGTYAESLVIDKGVTLEAVGGASGRVVIEPPGRPTAAVHVTALAPVSIRDVTVRSGSAVVILGDGAVNVILERDSVLAVDPPLGVGSLLYVRNDARITGARAHVVLRASALDGSITAEPVPPFPQSFGVRVDGDVDAMIAGNTIRRVGGACIFVQPRLDLTGETNAEVQNNEVDECFPLGRAASILIGPSAPMPVVKPPVTGAGTVNLVSNTIRNSTASCWPATGISYEFFTGRIERNTIVDVVQACAVAGGRNRAAAIWIGSRPPVNLPPVYPVVRYNNIAGNAQAGLRIGPNETAAVDATCNWFGTTSGPSGIGPGTGDAVVVEEGGVPPVITPFATQPIAGTAVTTCSGGAE